MNGLMNEWMVRVNEWWEEWMNGWIDEWMIGWVNGGMWMIERMSLMMHNAETRVERMNE